jgi:hypothetical protein
MRFTSAKSLVRSLRAGLREQIFYRHRLEMGIPDPGSIVI